MNELNLVEEHLNSNNSPFRFNAKELDEETGNYYYGARYGVYPEHSRRDPKFSIWISVDPLAEKYPSISSYAYVANNPINAIDPNGKEIVIIGENGKKTTYSQSMEYNGDDKFTAHIINKLNDMYTTEPGMVIVDYVVSDKQIVTVTNEKLSNKGAVGLAPDDSAGRMKLGNIKDSRIGLNKLAHELFHGYQQMKGQGGTSIKNEVEAYLFRDLIERLFNDFGMGTDFQSSENLEWFEMTFTFYEKPFSEEDFQYFIENFKEDSKANSKGDYNSFPRIRDNQLINLYKDLHPIQE